MPAYFRKNKFNVSVETVAEIGAPRRLHGKQHPTTYPFGRLTVWNLHAESNPTMETINSTNCTGVRMNSWKQRFLFAAGYLGATLLLVLPRPAVAQVNVVMQHYDLNRTGANL